jgi:hypothetical protein
LPLNAIYIYLDIAWERGLNRSIKSSMLNPVIPCFCSDTADFSFRSLDLEKVWRALPNSALERKRLSKQEFLLKARQNAEILLSNWFNRILFFKK